MIYIITCLVKIDYKPQKYTFKLKHTNETQKLPVSSTVIVVFPSSGPGVVVPTGFPATRVTGRLRTPHSETQSLVKYLLMY